MTIFVLFYGINVTVHFILLFKKYLWDTLYKYAQLTAHLKMKSIFIFNMIL